MCRASESIGYTLPYSEEQDRYAQYWAGHCWNILDQKKYEQLPGFLKSSIATFGRGASPTFLYEGSTFHTIPTVFHRIFTQNRRFDGFILSRAILDIKLNCPYATLYQLIFFPQALETQQIPSVKAVMKSEEAFYHEIERSDIISVFEDLRSEITRRSSPKVER